MKKLSFSDLLERSLDWGIIFLVPFMIIGVALSILIGIPIAMVAAAFGKGKE